MKPEEILKDEFCKRMKDCMEAMQTAPDFSCALISLLITKDVLNDLIKATAEGIEMTMDKAERSHSA